MVILVFIIFLAFTGFLLWYLLKGNVIKLSTAQLHELFMHGKLGNKENIVFDGLSISLGPNAVFLEGYLSIDGKIIHYSSTIDYNN